jgi:hypothetical protein
MLRYTAVKLIKCIVYENVYSEAVVFENFLKDYTFFTTKANCTVYQFIIVQWNCPGSEPNFFLSLKLRNFGCSNFR